MRTGTAHGIGILDLKTFKPLAKNPPISKVFREIGFADKLGSGMRNSYKYTKLYSGAEPEFIEGDVFEIIIPLTTGAMTKVGPGTSPVPGGEVGTHAGTQTEHASSTHTEDTDNNHAITITLDVNKLNELLGYCSEYHPGRGWKCRIFAELKQENTLGKRLLFQ